MKIKITTTLFKYDRTVQILDMDKPIVRLRTSRHPRKGEDIIPELFLKAIQDVKDTNELGILTLSEVMYFYDIELAYYEEQKQYARDFRF